MLLASRLIRLAYSGRLEKAREFSRQAVTFSRARKRKKRRQSYEADAALREALFGNAAEARQRAAAALGTFDGPRRAVWSGVGIWLCVGDAARAQTLGR